LQLRSRYFEAEHWISVAVDQHRALGDALGSALTLGMLGQLVLMRGDLQRAGEVCAEAAELLSALGNAANVAIRLQLGLVATELGDLTRATEIISQCESQDVESHPALAAWVQILKGRVAAACGDPPRAEQLLKRALATSREIPQQLAVVTVLVELGNVH